MFQTFVIFQKNSGLHGEKRKKLLQICNFHIINDFLTVFFTFFTMLTWIFFKNNKSLEHLNVLLRIFFVSGVFQNFHVDFWPLLKAEKVVPPKQFWWKKFFSLKFYFLSSIWIYKLSASRITENSSHCYTLTINKFYTLKVESHMI